jgi:putative ABC transport system permease protein
MQMNALAAAIRHLKKHPRFAVFNIFGLTVAFIAFFFISVYVSHEVHYDDHNIHRDLIYRIDSRLNIANDITEYATAPPVIGATIQSKVPSIQSACRIYAERNLKFALRDEYITENEVAYADPSIFDVFTLPLLPGHRASPLKLPNTIVMSKSAALKYFGRADVVGETMSMFENDSLHSLTVSAVMQDIPRQSHFHFNFLLPMVNLPIHSNGNFLSFYPVSTYVLVAPGSNVKKLNVTINAWIRSSIPDYDEIKRSGNEISMVLTPIKKIHLQSHKKYELSKNGHQQYIYIFSGGAVFILIMAGINFMNLSLARFSERVKESAVKKILGSSVASLSIQYMAESLLLCFLSTVLAFIAGWSLMNAFNGITDQSITLSDVIRSSTIPMMWVTATVMGLISAVYPALLLSSLQPTAIMNGRNCASGSRASISIRHVLLVIQFVVSTFMITSTIIVYRQLSFIHHKATGYNKQELLVIRNASSVDNPVMLKEKILGLPGAISATLSNFLPTNTIRWSNFGGTRTSTNPVQTEFWPVDEDYIPTLGINLLKGRNFQKSRLSDSAAIILNETAYRMFGNDNKIFNEEISFSYHQQPKAFHVIGVVKNFHFNSFRQSVGPLVLVLSDEPRSLLTIKYHNNVGNTFQDQVQGVWQSLQASEKMNFSYIDDDFNALYKEDDLMGKLFSIFATISILIAGLGLFSFISHSISVRRKEIAIRKILGASKRSTAILISRNYILLVTLSIALAIPIARFVMIRWLEGFAYRYEIQFIDYISAGVLSLLVVLVTLSTRVFAFSTKRLINNIKTI